MGAQAVTGHAGHVKQPWRGAVRIFSRDAFPGIEDPEGTVMIVAGSPTFHHAGRHEPLFRSHRFFIYWVEPDFRDGKAWCA